jgi:hypothetical protein
LEWTSNAILGGDSPSTLNLTIKEPSNASVTYKPSNTNENTSNDDSIKYGNITIVSIVNDIPNEILIEASSYEEAVENTTIINGLGNWSIEVCGHANYLDWPAEINWELAITVYHYDGSIKKQ